MPVESGTLAMAWTVRCYRDRLLGGNKEARVKIQTVFMSSGNNVMFSRELNRRVVRIELLATTENPSLRTGFKHDPLLDWARENRWELTRACLVLCRHWIAEGRPPGTQVMGSYESYVRTMGGILGACGVEGFLANRPRAVIRDPESDRWGELVSEWHRQHGTRLVSTADVWKIIGGDEDLAQRFGELLGEGSHNSQKTRLGRALEKHENRVWSGWRIVRSSVRRSANKTTLWRLQDPNEPIAEDQDEEPEEGTGSSWENPSPEGGDTWVPF
jgi:hypothetical protein